MRPQVWITLLVVMIAMTIALIFLPAIYEMIFPQRIVFQTILDGLNLKYPNTIRRGRMVFWGLRHTQRLFRNTSFRNGCSQSGARAENIGGHRFRSTQQQIEHHNRKESTIVQILFGSIAFIFMSTDNLLHDHRYYDLLQEATSGPYKILGDTARADPKLLFLTPVQRTELLWTSKYANSCVSSARYR